MLTLKEDDRLDTRLQPIAVLDDDLDARWIGREASWAGLGERADGKRGRAFVTQTITGLTAKYVNVGAVGRGACFGDSGGPLLVSSGDRELRVAGVLHAGDPDCRGQDQYTRVDAARLWIRAQLSVGDSDAPAAPSKGAR